MHDRTARHGDRRSIIRHLHISILLGRRFKFFEKNSSLVLFTPTKKFEVQLQRPFNFFSISKNSLTHPHVVRNVIFKFKLEPDGTEVELVPGFRVSVLKKAKMQLFISV